MTLQFLRIWAGEDGETHIDPVSPDLKQVEGYTANVPIVGVSGLGPVQESHLLNLPAGWVGDYHPSPRRQLMTQLTGRVRVQASDGATVDAGPGTLWLIEDVAGKGHHTTVTSAEDAVFFVATAEQEA